MAYLYSGRTYLRWSRKIPDLGRNVFELFRIWLSALMSTSRRILHQWQARWESSVRPDHSTTILALEVGLDIYLLFFLKLNIINSESIGHYVQSFQLEYLCSSCRFSVSDVLSVSPPYDIVFYCRHRKYSINYLKHVKPLSFSNAISFSI